MDALVVTLPFQCAPCFSYKSTGLSNDHVRLSRSRAFVGVRGFHRAWHQWGEGSRVNSLNGSASSFENSSQEDDPDEPPVSKKDTENGGIERLVNDEKSAKNELPTTPSCLPSNEILLRLRRNAELRKEYNGSAKPSSHQPSADLEMHDSEARAPSWAITALTFAVAFSAGVALAQCRGGLSSRNKPAVVDVRVAPSGIASVPYPEQLLGHFRVEEAPESDLKAILADGSVRLRTAAADAFLRMQEAARQEGIWLIPLSGFRSVSSQQGVFFDIKAERMQSATERGKSTMGYGLSNRYMYLVTSPLACFSELTEAEYEQVSAPPGYSEHHTGYAIDIGDATDSKTYLQSKFEEGAAYRWLQQNAARFHFELSFPKDNLQGIMYEPWHWRFVGDDHSLITFYAQHKFYNSFPRYKT